MQPQNRNGTEVAEPTPVEDPMGLILDTLQGWWKTAIEMLPNLAVAVVVLIVFWILARLVRSTLRRGLKSTPVQPPVRRLLVRTVGFGILATGLFVALGVLGLSKTVTTLLAGVGILGLALGFAFQDIAANFMSGIMMTFRRPFELGERIESHGYEGSVEEISLRSTVIRTPTGQMVRIPNKEVYSNPLVNYSETGVRRVDLGCGVSYGDDLEKVRKVALEALEGISHRVEDRGADFFYTEFGGSSIDFVVRFWVEYARHGQYLQARSEAIGNLKAAFDREGIVIPFPIRTLDFGVAGGKGLGEELEPVVASLGRGGDSSGDTTSER